MARSLNRLTVRSIDSIKKSGVYADGGGLYLSTVRDSRRWIFVFRWQGKRREMGLGLVDEVTLARARSLAGIARSQVQDGINPVEQRRAERLQELEQPEAELTFAAFAESYIASVEAGWRNPVHRQQWRNSLRDHAASLASKPIASVDTDDVLDVLRPIWLTLPETASRVRGRIERILAAAKAMGLRDRDAANPAQWRGHLDILLPKRIQLSRGHHPAMPYEMLPDFMVRLADRPAMAARALEFLILNASRTSEVLGAKWGEVTGNLWTVPKERMKTGVAHTVTLSPPAVHILSTIGEGAPDSYIFKGQREQRPLSNMSMEMLLRRMGAGQFTVHGFRSSFKDWAANCTEYPDEISEEALSHSIGSKVRRAYRRGEALDRRMKLMSGWSSFLSLSMVTNIGSKEAA